jgi:DNA-binding phage protein
MNEAILRDLASKARALSRAQAKMDEARAELDQALVAADDAGFNRTVITETAGMSRATVYKVLSTWGRL